MKAIILAGALALAFFSTPASASLSACDRDPGVACYTPETQSRVHGLRPGIKKKRIVRPRAAYRGSRGMVAVQCGPSQIWVAPGARIQIDGFCRDLFARYKFKVAGGFSHKRPRTCHEGNRHRCGSAVDISQSCRSKGPGHCLPGDFPVLLSEQLADKWGLFPGSRWAHRDVGHFQTKGTLYGSNWPENRLVQVAAAAVTRLLPDDPEPRHPFLGAGWQVASVNPADIPLQPEKPSEGARECYPDKLYAEASRQVMAAAELFMLHPTNLARKSVDRFAALGDAPERKLEKPRKKKYARKKYRHYRVKLAAR